MAKLIRQKKQAELGSVGVVRMTGLRAGGQAWGETARAAESFGDIMSDELKRRRIQEGQEDFASKRFDPEYAFTASVANNMEDVELDATGQPKKRVGEVIKGQVVLQEGQLGGLLTNSYHEAWNRDAMNANTNTAFLQMEAALKTKYKEVKNLGDYTTFKKWSDEYIKNTIETVHPRSRAAVANQIAATQSKNYFNLMETARNNSRKSALDTHADVSNIMRNNLEQAIISHGIDDQGTQDYFMAAALHELNLPNLQAMTPDQVMKRINDQNVRVVHGQVINMINNLSADGQYSEADMLKVDEYLNTLIKGGGKVKVMGFDPATNQVGLREVFFVEALPNEESRNAIATSLKGIIRDQKAVSTQQSKLRSDILVSQINLNLSGILSDRVSGDASGIADKMREFESIRERIGNMPQEEQADLAIKLAQAQVNALGKMHSTAKEQMIGDELVPMVHEIQKSILGALPEGLLKQANNSRVGMADAQAIISNPHLAPNAKLSALKSQLEVLNQLRSAHAAAQKKVAPIVQRVASGDQYVPHNKSDSETIDSMIKNQATAFGAVDSPAKFSYINQAEDGTYDWVTPSNMAKPFANTGTLPSGLVDQMRGFINSNDPDRIMASWRIFNSLKNTTAIKQGDLDKALGENFANAFNYLESQYTIAGAFPNNQEIFDDMNRLLQGKPIESLEKIERNTVKGLINDKLTSIFGDDPSIPPEMRDEILFAVESQLDGKRDINATFNKVWDKFTETGKARWGISDYGVKDRWVKHPIDAAYPELVLDSLTGKDYDFFNNRLRANIVAKSGGTFMVGETMVNMDDVHLPNESQEFGVDKYQMKFMYHRKDSEGKPVFRAVVKSYDPRDPEIPIYTSVTDSRGRILEVDLRDDVQLETDRKSALTTVDQQIASIESKIKEDELSIAFADEYGTGEGEDVVLESNKRIEEYKADIRALQRIKIRLRRFEYRTGESTFTTEQYKNYTGENLVDLMRKIAIMSDEEYEKYRLSGEGNVE